MNLMKQDLDNIDTLANSITRWSSKFQLEVGQHPVAVTHNPLPAAEAIEQNGVGAKTAFDEFRKNIAPKLSGSVGPRYLGFVTGGVTPAALFGDWLAATVDQNVMVPGDSISTAIELQVLQWLGEMFALGHDFEGVLTSGATSANLLGILTGRQFAGETQGLDIASEGLGRAHIEIFSACPHASLRKVTSFAGLSRESLKQVPCITGTEQMDVPALAKLLNLSTAPGKIVVASAGTVTGTDFDDLLAVTKLCKEFNAWLHVDAAFGLFSRLVPEMRGLSEGINGADSITCDSHKWLNVPYDSGIFFTRHPQILNRTCSVSAPYLKVTDELPALMDRGIENSRRFRALPIWMTLKAYGKQGYKNLVQRNCGQAKRLAAWISKSPDYQLMTSCKLNVVTFRPTNDSVSTPEVLAKINNSGLVYLTPGMWLGQECIRAAFSNWRTESGDVETICEVLEAAASAD